MSSTWKEVLSLELDGKDNKKLLAEIQKTALESTEDVEIVFGTSGWRAVIGEEYSLYNVQKVTRAIVAMYRNASGELLTELGVDSFEDFASRGVLLGHDTRYMGDVFAKGVATVLNKEKIKIFYCAVATTPEFSAAVPEDDFACSINLTPSHNPGNYGGYKFNPADGGPAGPLITKAIEAEILKINDKHILPVKSVRWDNYDILSAYIDFVNNNDFVDLEFCREMAKGKMALAHDAVYGATKGRPDVILGNPPSLKTFRTKDNPLFGGAAPEPSVNNMAELVAYIDAQPQELKLGVIMDPDGDRVRFYDGQEHISMNQFGAIAFDYIVNVRKKEGGVAKSVATSNLINALAKKYNRPLYETAVGFKNFRPYLSEGTQKPALVCFEESDGISGYGNTLEKDAQIGFLLAIEIIGKTGKSLSDHLHRIQEDVGQYFPLRKGFEVESIKQVKPVMEQLKTEFVAGKDIEVGGNKKSIVEAITLDGLKLVFEDSSWMLIRPSGTEPKVRVYTESQNLEQSELLFEAAKNLFFTKLK